MEINRRVTPREHLIYTKYYASRGRVVHFKAFAYFNYLLF